VEINPAVVSSDGVSVLSARVRVAPPVRGDDLGPRRMRWLARPPVPTSLERRPEHADEG